MRVVLFLVGLLLAGSAAAKEIRISMDWAWQGGQAPFALAEQAGFFKAEGLDIVMDRGNGSVDVVTRIAGGAYDVAFGDLSPMVKFDAEQPDKALIAVLVLYDRSPLAVLSLKKSGIATPKALEGKTIAAPEADAGRALFPAFAKAAKLDMAKIAWQSVTPQLRETMLFKGQADAITGFITSGIFNLAALGVPRDDITVMRYGDYGVDLYGSAVYVKPSFAAENPEIMKKIVRVAIKGHQAAYKDPAAAIAAIKKRDPLADGDLELKRLGLVNDELLATETVRKQGIGTVDPARLARMIDTIVEAYGIKAPPKPEQIYTDKYLPPAAERQLPAKL